MLHVRRFKFWRGLKRTFIYGLLRPRIEFKYGQSGFASSSTSKTRKGFRIIKREIYNILKSIIYLIALSLGVTICFIEKTVKGRLD